MLPFDHCRVAEAGLNAKQLAVVAVSYFFTITCPVKSYEIFDINHFLFVHNACSSSDLAFALPWIPSFSTLLCHDCLGTV